MFIFLYPILYEYIFTNHKKIFYILFGKEIIYIQFFFKINFYYYISKLGVNLIMMFFYLYFVYVSLFSNKKHYININLKIIIINKIKM